jgi:hypothetical protein
VAISGVFDIMWRGLYTVNIQGVIVPVGTSSDIDDTGYNLGK